MPTVEELEQDTASLEYEISQLQRKKTDLLKEIEKAKKKDPLSSSLNQLRALLQSKNRHTVSPEQRTSEVPVVKKRKTNDMTDFLIPNPVSHEYFDRSINKYFVNNTKEQTVNELDVENLKKNGMLLTIQKSENVLLENVYRMFGITAFPVKKPNSKASAPDLLGIRIEIFNESDLIFETPHYLILQQNSKNSKWDIYKHTIPNFIQLRKIAEEKYDNLSEPYLLDFVREIREILNKVVLKHQLIDKLKTDLSENVKNLEKDIPLEILKFDLKIPYQVVTPVIINLSLENIESSYIERGFSETEKVRINNVLKGDVKNFQDRLRDVIYSISST